MSENPSKTNAVSYLKSVKIPMRENKTKSCTNTRFGEDGTALLGIPILWLISMGLIWRAYVAIFRDEYFSLLHFIYLAALVTVTFFLLVLISIALCWLSSFTIAYHVALVKEKLAVKPFFRKKKEFELSEISTISLIPQSTFTKYATYLSPDKNNYILQLKTGSSIKLSGDMEGLDEFVRLLSQKSGV